MRPEAKAVVEEIKALQLEIQDMDDKVKQFLANRKRYSHPEIEDLVSRVRRFENRTHSFRDAEVQLRLDSLMHSLLIHQEIWRRWFEEDEKKAPPPQGAGASERDAGGPPQADSLADRLYESARQKCRELNVPFSESREAFSRRVVPDLEKARASIQRGQKVGFTYDRSRQQIQVKIKESP